MVITRKVVRICRKNLGSFDLNLVKHFAKNEIASSLALLAMTTHSLSFFVIANEAKQSIHNGISTHFLKLTLPLF